ncbi:hypothetical protein ETU09_04135 [Apibacter muscae]|uniref:Uncharacterized protein n=1 Tax=Apibacter muscae TaxID=2509004 RepID=A0A563DFL4_9FLAO|nr:hypothetical protein [Apibacter muscae]TWP29036.1 hypothetical protein ETU09_04135 [Apibacter muscae]
MEYFFNFLVYINAGFNKKIILIFEVAFILSCIITLRSIKFGKKIIDKVTTLIYMVSPIIIFICIPGALIFTENFNILPRVLVGSSIFIIFILYSFNEVMKKNWKYLLILPYIYFFSLMYSYGASLTIYKNHKEYLISQINHDLYKLGIKNGDKLYILGSPEYPPPVSLFISKHKFTGYFFLANNFNSNKYFINEFFILHNLKIEMFNFEKELDTYKQIKVKDEPNINQGIYKIYRDGDEYIIWFP